MPFTVTIVDPCDEPVSVTSSTLVNQEYTISQASFDYTIPVFVADPDWCEIVYTYDVTHPDGDQVIVFD